MGVSRQRGNILISVLWVIVTMTILVAALSFEARSDIERASNYRNRAKAYWMARAAVERVKYDVALSKQRLDEEYQPKARYSYDFEDGYAECLIQSNSSLMPVNSSSRTLWRQLFKFFGLDEMEQDEVIDAMFDWRDGDDLPRLNGVESEYYSDLSPPYAPRNGPFYSIEELMLVKGITEKMFYGGLGEDGTPQPGLKDILSLSAPGITKFDINTAPKGILLAFLEITDEEAELLIKTRDERLFESVQEAGSLIDIEAMDNLSTFFTMNRSNQIRIKATAYVKNSLARHTVEDEVRYVGTGKMYINNSHKDFSLEHVDEIVAEEEE